MRPFSRLKFKQKFVLAGTQSPPGRTLGRYNFIKFIIKYFKVVICNFNKFGKLKQQKFFLRRRKFKCADTGRPNRHPLGLQVSSNCINLLTWLELIDWAAEWGGRVLWCRISVSGRTDGTAHRRRMISDATSRHCATWPSLLIDWIFPMNRLGKI